MKYGRFLTALIMLWAACFSVVFAAEEVSNVETLELSFHSSKHFKLNVTVRRFMITVMFRGGGLHEENQAHISRHLVHAG